MSLTRREFIAGAGSAALAGAVPLRSAFAAGAPIKLGTLLDNSGNLDLYGKPMSMATTMAVEEINAAGGLLGRKIQLIQYDTQSDIALYTKFAQQLVRDDKVDVVHGGITSASREAIRQVFRRSNTLYFYNILYEGGVCDRNTIVTGTTPAQVVEPVIDLAMKKWGDKVYVLAADYNYGQITAKWIAHYVAQRKGTTLKTDFFPLDVSDFGSTIAKIQQEKPSFVVSALVGGAHMSFYRQWAASGMNKKIPLAATVFGVGNEQMALSAAEGGCQAEIGVASAMGAAAIAQAYGDAPQVAANAAEGALEHHLGMTCDPVAGFVQIPCIERCAFGAVKAWTGYLIAKNEIPANRRVDFDSTVDAMALTAKEMNSKYKETSEGGLAVSLVLC